MKNEIYLNAKRVIIEEAKKLKKENTDRGYINQCLNDQLDSMCRQMYFNFMRGVISEKKYKIYCIWLECLTANFTK